MYGQTLKTEVPSDSVPPGLSSRYEGNLASFKVDEQVALSTWKLSYRTIGEHDFLAEILAGLELGVFVRVVLTSFKLEVLANTLLVGLLTELAESIFELFEFFVLELEL